jgi:hypothetical protein
VLHSGTGIASAGSLNRRCNRARNRDGVSAEPLGG